MDYSNKAWCDTQSLVSIVETLKGDLDGIEIGVLRGGSSIDLLTNIPRIRKLVCIDPFLPYIGISFEKYQSAEFWEDMYKSVLDEFDKFDGRAELIRDKSENVASKLEDGKYDFIFIDGDHSYEGVKKDITLYEPKLKKGGLLIGHDYNKSHKDRVMKAVDEYVEKENRDLHLVQEGNGGPNLIYYWKV